MAPAKARTVAIEINSRQTWDILCALDPHMNELSFEENHGSFLAIDLDDECRWALMTPRTVGEIYDHIEPDPKTKLKFVTLVK